MAPRRENQSALPSTLEELAQMIAQHVNAAFAQRDATRGVHQNANQGMPNTPSVTIRIVHGCCFVMVSRNCFVFSITN